MRISIQFFVLFAMQVQNFQASDNNKKEAYKKSRTVKFTKEPTALVHSVALSHPRKVENLKTVVEHGIEYTLVPTKLMGHKLTKYFKETSVAHILMSCCGVPVHRRCLRDMFHAQEHQCSGNCPGCKQIVDRSVFRQSRPQFIALSVSKILCNYCSKS